MHKHLHNLITLLGSLNDYTRTQAAYVLQNLSNSTSEVQQRMIDAAAIEYLTQLTANASDHSKIPAITTLYHLSFGAEAVKVRMVPCITHVVQFLSDPFEGVSPKAVKILQNLALDSRERQAAIVKCNPIPLFHKLFVKNTHDIALINTLAALASLSDDVRKDIDKNDVIRLVVDTLKAATPEKNPDYRLASAAANVITALANGPDSVRKSIIKSGGVQCLVGLLAVNDHDLMFNCTTDVFLFSRLMC